MIDPATDHLESLYLTDGNGRLTAINQWDGGRPPRFHLCRSPLGNTWRFRADLDGKLIRQLDRLCAGEPVGGDLCQDPQLSDPCLQLLERSEPVTAVWRGPVFAFPERFENPELPYVISITPATAHLLEALLPDWQPDVPHRQPFSAVLADGVAVAVCASVRIHPRVHAAGVETHPNHRHRGYARCAVAAWGAAVRQAGLEPLYSTSWENVASLGVARSLGLRLVAADFHIT